MWIVELSVKTASNATWIHHIMTMAAVVYGMIKIDYIPSKHSSSTISLAKASVAILPSLSFP